MTTTKRYRHILWDWNGTLLDDVDLCAELLNRLLTNHGLQPVSRRTYRQSLGFPIIEYYRKLGFDFDQTPFEKLGSEFMRMYRRRWRECALQPGARAALDAAAGMGLSQSILSATEINLLREGVAHFGIESSFHKLAALDNPYAAGKVEIGLKLLKKLPIDPDRILMIGDTRHDLDVASALGIDCWLVTCGHHSDCMLADSGVPLLASLNAVTARFS